MLLLLLLTLEPERVRGALETFEFEEEDVPLFVDTEERLFTERVPVVPSLETVLSDDEDLVPTLPVLSDLEDLALTPSRVEVLRLESLFNEELLLSDRNEELLPDDAIEEREPDERPLA